MEEIFETIWSYALPVFGGISVGALITGIGSSLLKSIANKLVTKFNEKVESTEDIASQVLDKLKNVSFTQTVAPLAQSELMKITETANTYITSVCKELEERQNLTLNVLEKLASYFDDAIGISDTKKEELHQAIEEAKEVLAQTGEQISEISVSVADDTPTSETTTKVEVDR